MKYSGRCGLRKGFHTPVSRILRRGRHAFGVADAALADYLEDAAPASEVDEGVDFAGVLLALVGESLLGEGGGVVGVVLLEGEVDEGVCRRWLSRGTKPQ